MKQLRAERRRKDPSAAKSGDLKLEAADALFSMLESKDAYVPTRGREGKEVVEPTGRAKGVRT